MSLPAESSKYLIDNTVYIAAVKKGWTRSTELILYLLDCPVTLVADALLIFEYEKYAKVLGTYDLLNYMKKSAILIIPLQKNIDACAPFFPDSELSDIVHAAACLNTGAILITNDNHFDRIKEARLIEVWSITKAIRRLLDSDSDYED
jgi:predicted nucleic acid-binding protein